MAWFKKSADGDTSIMNASQLARAPLPEPLAPSRTEPRIEVRPVSPRAFENRAPAAAAKACVLGPTVRFRGELTASEDLILHGSVEGSITHEQCLTIGPEGSVKGDIRARVIVVDGRIDGDLYATESVNIRATGKVRGNVCAPSVGILEGAFFEGQIDMRPAAAAVQAPGARFPEAPTAAPLEAPAVAQLLDVG
jgi:cytoskeletal protein CcmA (bactofilin family)